MPDFEARCQVLTTENEQLRERVRQLEEMLGMAFDAPAFLDLSPDQAKLFGVLMARDALTRPLAMDVLYGRKPNGDEAEVKIVDVQICKLRQRLEPFGIAIETNWGQGYFLKPETKKKARELMAAHASEAA